MILEYSIRSIQVPLKMPLKDRLHLYLALNCNSNSGLHLPLEPHNYPKKPVRSAKTRKTFNND